jgi:TRAP-type C4-dicarboxylate transport system substrate-binding protein
MFSANGHGRVPTLLSAVAVAAVAMACSSGSPSRATPTGASGSVATNQPVASVEPFATDDAVATSEVLVLKLANTYGDLEQVPGVAYFIDQVHERSDGAIQINVAHSYGAFTPDVEDRVVRHVAEGHMDLAWIGTRVIDTMGVESFEALTAPRLVDSYALQNAIIEAGITREMLPALDELGVVGLGVLADGLRKPIGVNGPIVVPADWDGIGFGTYRSATQEAAIRALGATPAQVFGPNRELAVANDEISGFEMSMSIYQDPKWVDLARHVTANVNLWPQMTLLIATPALLAAMTPEQRGWIEDAADDAANRSASLADVEAPAIEAACEAGARFTRASDADLVALDESFASVYDTLESHPQTKAFIDEIRALKEATPAEPDPAIPSDCIATSSAGGPSSTAQPAADPLAGEWRQTFTCEDAAEAVRRAVPAQDVVNSGWSCDLPGAQTRIARFEDGRVFLLDPPSHEVGLSASYEIVDDHTFTLSDGDENIPGSYRFEYRFEGEELIVDVLEVDPYFVGTWEAAPFVPVE